MPHQPICLLLCLMIASVLAWYGISLWEVEFGALAPGPTMEATFTAKEKREDPKTLIWMKEMEAQYEERRQRIKNVCSKNPEILQRNESSIANNFLIDPLHKLAYCRHGKVGTSTWLEYFLTLSNVDSKFKTFVSGRDKLLHHVVPKLYRHHKDFDDLPDGAVSLDQKLRQDNYLTFSFVRHPFDRLVSAYEDKILNLNDASYYAKVALIEELFGETTFENFIKFILQSDEVKSCSATDCSLVDAHWRPFYGRCAYCDIHYDVLGLVESFGDDVRYIMMKRNLKSLLDQDGTVLHLHHATEMASDSFNSFQRQRTLNYFSNLSNQTVTKLIELYKIDFELFDFDIKPFV